MYLKGVDLAALGGNQLGGQTFGWLSPRSVLIVGLFAVSFALKGSLREIHLSYGFAIFILLYVK